MNATRGNHSLISCVRSYEGAGPSYAWRAAPRQGVLMKKRLVLVFMLVFLVLPAVHAQDNADVWTTADLNLRSGPGTGNTAITLLPAQTALLAEARSADNGWLL